MGGDAVHLHGDNCRRCSVRGSMCPLRIEALIPGPQNVTVFGDGAFEDVIKLNWAITVGQIQAE